MQCLYFLVILFGRKNYSFLWFLAAEKKNVQMCGSRKCPYSPYRRDWKFLGVGDLKDQKTVWSLIGLSRRVGVLGKIPSMGEVWIMNDLPVIGSVVMSKWFWDHQGANIASRKKKMYSERLFNVRKNNFEERSTLFHHYFIRNGFR